VSNINFDILIRGALCISHDKLPKDGKVLCHLEIKSKILPGSLSDVSTRWDNAPKAHSRVSNINFDILVRGDPIYIP
jgi:hypothetical protein